MVKGTKLFGAFLFNTIVMRNYHREIIFSDKELTNGYRYKV